MDINKPKKNISTYRSFMGVRESVLSIDALENKRGLGFSDYFDKSVPYDVKPTFPTMPTREAAKDESKPQPDDYPLRAKDLYKGLWEELREEHPELNEGARILVKGSNYWLDPRGNFHNVDIEGHGNWAKQHMANKGWKIPSHHDRVESHHLLERGFINVRTDEDMLMIEYAKTRPPTPLQWKVLEDTFIESGFKVFRDDTTHKNIPIHEAKERPTNSSVKWYWMNKDGRVIEIEDPYDWAVKYLSDNEIPFQDENKVEEEMFKLRFVLVLIAGGIINYTYGFGTPNKRQMDTLIHHALKSHFHLYDKTKHRVMYYSKEPLSEDKDNKELFIESMMPEDMDTFKSHLAQLFSYLKEELQLKSVPKVKLLSDDKNAAKVLGKTAYYDPTTRTVCLYTTNRHQKDVLRSFAHEIIHHWQHENEKLQTTSSGGAIKTGKNEELHGSRPYRRGMEKDDPQYAQNDPWLRQMEKQAYLLGNILFRDWEDQKKAKDRKSGKKMVELHGNGNVRHDSHTPIMKQRYSKNHAYRKGVEGPQDGILVHDKNDIEERTYLIGKEYPPKKMDYRG